MISKLLYGIALEGGGAKAAYQMGAWKAFMEKGFSFHAISGASMGAINGAFMVQNDYEKAMAFWNELSLKRYDLVDVKKARGFMFRLIADMGLLLLPLPLGKLRWVKYARYFALLAKSFSEKGSVSFLLKEGLLNTPMLEAILLNHLNLDLLREARTDLYIFAYETRGKTGAGGQGTTFIKARDLDAQTLKSYLMASIAFPLMFPSVTIEESTYRDGDLILPDILSPLRETALERIFVVHSRAWKRLLGDNHSDPRITHILPSRNIGALYRKTFDFSFKHIDKVMETGYSDASKTINR